MIGRVRQAVVMVGGKGTRLRPLTDTCPKPALPVLDRPCIDYLIGSLAAAGVEEVVLACGYRSEELAEAVGDGGRQGVRIVYSREDSPMGTGGALKLLEGRLDPTFVAANGDVFADVDVAAQVRAHVLSGAAVTMSLAEVADPSEYGIARVGPDGRVSEFLEKPGPGEAFSNLVNSGVYVVDRRVLRLIPEGRPCDLSRDIFPLLLRKGLRLQGSRMSGGWRDVGRPRDLYEANIEAARRAGGRGPGEVSDSRLSGTVHVGRGAKVLSSELDSTVVSEGCTVTEARVSRSLLLPGCAVESAEVSGSVLGRGCRVMPGASVRGCVLADGTAVPAGAEVVGGRGV